MISVDSNVVFENEQVAKKASHCPQGVSSTAASCTVTHYSETQSVQRVKTTATYGGAPITYAQFKVLTDPTYDAKLAQLEQARSRCSGGSLPRWVGIGLMVASLVVTSSSEQTTRLVRSVSMTAGLATYAFGYFRYATPCNQANDLFNQVNFSQDVGRNVIDGDEAAREMRVLTDRFNARRAGVARN